MPTLFDYLNTSKTDDVRAIKRAWFNFAKQNHPDRNLHLGAEELEKITKVFGIVIEGVREFNALSEEKRAQYMLNPPDLDRTSSGKANSSTNTPIYPSASFKTWSPGDDENPGSSTAITKLDTAYPLFKNPYIPPPPPRNWLVGMFGPKSEYLHSLDFLNRLTHPVHMFEVNNYKDPVYLQFKDSKTFKHPLIEDPMMGPKLERELFYALLSELGTVNLEAASTDAINYCLHQLADLCACEVRLDNYHDMLKTYSEFVRTEAPERPALLIKMEELSVPSDALRIDYQPSSEPGSSNSGPGSSSSC